MMRRTFLTTICLFLLVCGAWAQSSLVATLNHQGKISTYYGGEAFVDAMNAAVDGDAITLSAGQFKGCDITKAITLRGSGMQYDEAHKQRATRLDGLNIRIPEAHSPFYVEGIEFYGNVYLYNGVANPTFVRCRFARELYGGKDDKYGKTDNASFINCNFQDLRSIYFSSTFQNCIVRGYPDDNQQKMFKNCVVQAPRRGTYINCILIDGEEGTGNNYMGETTQICQNCVAITGNPAFFDKMPNYSNTIATMADVFKEYEYAKFASLDFELTASAKSNYKGTDGTVVGIYGGEFPYNTTTSTPHITDVKTAKTSGTDNKLTVTVNVAK